MKIFNPFTISDSYDDLLDKSKIPFSLNNKVVQMIGNEMGFFLSAFAGKDFPDKTYHVILTCLKHNGVSEDSSVYMVARDIALLIDRDVFCEDEAYPEATYSGKGNGYHNARHMIEVILNVQLLLTIADTFPDIRDKITLSVDDRGLLLLAALVHDLGYVPQVRMQDTETYFLEKRSVRLAELYVRKYFEHEAAEEIMKKLMAMVCSTNVEEPEDTLLKALDYARGESSLDANKGDFYVQAEFVPLFNKSSNLAELAAMLCDADIATSVAYNFACCWDASLRLAEEMAVRGVAESEGNALKYLIRFLEDRASLKSLAGKVFIPNFSQVRSNTQSMVVAQDSMEDYSC